MSDDRYDDIEEYNKYIASLMYVHMCNRCFMEKPSMWQNYIHPHRWVCDDCKRDEKERIR